MLQGKCVIEVWRGSQSLAVVEGTARGFVRYAGYVDGRLCLTAPSREAAIGELLRSCRRNQMHKGEMESVV